MHLKLQLPSGLFFSLRLSSNEIHSPNVLTCLRRRSYWEIAAQVMTQEALRRWPEWNPGEMCYYDIFLEGIWNWIVIHWNVIFFFFPLKVRLCYPLMIHRLQSRYTEHCNRYTEHRAGHAQHRQAAYKWARKEWDHWGINTTTKEVMKGLPAQLC